MIFVFLEVFKIQLDKVLSNLVWIQCWLWFGLNDLLSDSVISGIYFALRYSLIVSILALQAKFMALNSFLQFAYYFVQITGNNFMYRLPEVIELISKKNHLPQKPQ